MDTLQFGFSLIPTTDLAGHRALVRAAEAGGLDLVGIQDHPYVATYLDTFVLIGTLLAETERLRFFPDVANLPLRPPAMLAKAAASLDLLSSGRFELALGAGAFWTAIAAMGVPRLPPGEALNALEEGVRIIQAMWAGGTVRIRGQHYQVSGVHSGPPPAHPISIWLGSQGPRALRLAGRVADGWAAPIPSYLPYEQWANANALIDQGAREAGRDPRQVLRMVQLVGTITDQPGEADARHGAEPIRGTARQWAELIARLATEQPFRAYIFWPEQQTAEQIERFARDVVPLARQLSAAR